MLKIKSNFTYFFLSISFFIIVFFVLPKNIESESNLFFYSIVNFYFFFFNSLENLHFSIPVKSLFLFFLIKLVLYPINQFNVNIKKIIDDFNTLNNSHLLKIKKIKNPEKKYAKLHSLYKANRFNPFFPLFNALLNLHQIPFIISFYSFFNLIKNHERESFLWTENVFEPDNVNLMIFDINLIHLLFFLFLSIIFWNHNFKFRLNRYISLIIISIFFFYTRSEPFMVIFIWFVYILDYFIKSKVK